MRNTLGAFSDGAVLFPLMALLSVKGGFSGAALLISAGLAYIAAAFLFRIPMSVQPLKSIAIASVALGASHLEVRFSGVVLGLVCLILAHARLDYYIENLPKALIHGLQVGLGAILLTQGARYGWHFSAAALLSLIFLLPKEWSVLGLIATAGLVWGVVHGTQDAVSVLPPHAPSIRLGVIFGLVLPQVVLTLANSVVSTRDVAERYYGIQAGRVTVKRLLYSIGAGNLVSAAFGGLPFCHGSGGITAHYRGGATHWVSNVIIGTSLLAMALFQLVKGQFTLSYPIPVMSALLLATGFFHMSLAKPTWESSGGKLKMFSAFLTGLLTQNMILVLGVALVLEYGLLRERKIA